MADEGLRSGPPRTPAEAWEKSERSRAGFARMRGEVRAESPRDRLGWLGCVRDVLEVLKAVDPEKLPSAIWRLERECDEMARAAVDELARDKGGLRNLLEEMIRPAPGTGFDGGELDVRPPRRGGDGP